MTYVPSMLIHTCTQVLAHLFKTCVKYVVISSVVEDFWSTSWHARWTTKTSVCIAVRMGLTFMHNYLPVFMEHSDLFLFSFF